MTTLFDVLDGINSSGYVEENLCGVDQVKLYAESMGLNLTASQAEKIISVSKKWTDEVANGNGEWGRFRHEAEAALHENVLESQYE